MTAETDEKRKRGMPMTIIDTWAFKLNPAQAYLNAGERSMFDTLKEAGQISMFRLKKCARQACDGEVPNSINAEGKMVKPYCSKTCWRKDQQEDNK